MTQISLKLPKKDLEFLEWYSEKNATPKATLYRDITIETFREWKRNYLLNQYLRGDITVKNFCNLANITMSQAMNLIEQSQSEPEIPDSFIDHSVKMIDHNINNLDLSIFKNRIPIKRTSPPVEFDEEDEEG